MKCNTLLPEWQLGPDPLMDVPLTQGCSKVRSIAFGASFMVRRITVFFDVKNVCSGTKMIAGKWVMYKR